MQAANRPIAQRLLAESDTMKTAALANGFTADALGLTGKSWKRGVKPRRHQRFLAHERGQPVDF